MEPVVRSARCSVWAPTPQPKSAIIGAPGSPAQRRRAFAAQSRLPGPCLGKLSNTSKNISKKREPCSFMVATLSFGIHVPGSPERSLTETILEFPSCLRTPSLHFISSMSTGSTPHWQRETPPGHTDWHSGHTTVRLRRPKDNPSQKAQHAKATEKARATKTWLGRSRKNSSPLRTRAAGEPASRQLRNPAATIATKKQHAVKTGVATFNSRRRRLAAAAVFSSSVILIHTGLAVALHLPPRPRRVERRNDARRYHSCRAESAGSSQVQAFCPASCLLFLLPDVACCWQAALPKSDQRT